MSGSVVVADLVKSASRFGFFRLVRAIEQSLHGDATPADSPDRECVDFAHQPELTFPTGDVSSVTADEKVRVTTSFLGLLGAASPLSPEWTEQVLLGDDEGTLQSFYDAFHHRALSYLVLAWKTHTAEGAFDLHGKDLLSARLRSMAGVDAWAPPEDDPLPSMIALGVADHQRGQAQTVDRDAAERILERVFPGCNLKVDATVRRSVAFTQAEQATLGGPNYRLDGGLVYGSRCDDEGGLVRIRVGPFDARTYDAFMPGGDAYVALERIATRIFGGSVDVELEVHVEPGAAPATTLGAERGARLGVDARYEAQPLDSLSVRVPLVADASDVRRRFIQHDEDR